jgi:hypothetical protein
MTGSVRAPAAMAASSPHPQPETGSLRAAWTPSRALAAPALITPGLAGIISAADSADCLGGGVIRHG